MGIFALTFSANTWMPSPVQWITYISRKYARSINWFICHKDTHFYYLSKVAARKSQDLSRNVQIFQIILILIREMIHIDNWHIHFDDEPRHNRRSQDELTVWIITSQNIYSVCTVKIICGIGSRSDVDCTQTVFCRVTCLPFTQPEPEAFVFQLCFCCWWFDSFHFTLSSE